MIALLAVATLIAAPAPQAAFTARDMGRASVYAGMCSTIGWVSSQGQVVAEAEAYMAAHPDQTETQVQADMAVGIEAAKGEIDALLNAYRSSQDGAAFKAGLRKECDGIVRDLPAFLSRNADTDQQFEARMAEVLGGN